MSRKIHDIYSNDMNAHYNISELYFFSIRKLEGLLGTSIILSSAANWRIWFIILIWRGDDSRGVPRTSNPVGSIPDPALNLNPLC